VSFTVAQVKAAGGFSLVYADPAWDYTQAGRGAAENHYDEMPLAEIQALPIADVAAPNVVLALWGTWPQLPVVLATGADWGFEYKTCGFVWVKYHEGSGKRCVGGGFWTRANTEFCLLFVRGKNHPTRIDKAIRQLIETDDEEKVLLAPRGRHSAKPAEARDRLVQLFGDVDRVELFAREKHEGWACWGNEIDSDLEMR
jgi:N6-adenosine-specific RNA methylase IME4